MPKTLSLPSLPAMPALPGMEKEWARALAKGLGFILIFLALLIGWLIFRGDDIAYQRAERLASKTAIVSRLEASLAAEEEPALSTPPTATTEHAASAEPVIKPVATVAGDGPTFERFSKAFQPVAGRAPIAVVIADFGLSSSLADKAISTLPEMTTLSFSPYSNGLQELLGKTQQFERWLTLPMEGESLEHSDSGPLTLLKDSSVERTRDLMGQMLALGQAGFAGFITSRTHDFALPDLDTNPAWPMLGESGFGFVDGRAVGPGFAREYAQKNFIPYAHASEWIDRTMTASQMQTQLQTVERLAQMNGGAVLMVEPTPQAMDMIKSWSETLEGRSLQLAPLSYLAQ